MKRKQLTRLIQWILWPAIGAAGLTVMLLGISIYLYHNPAAGFTLPAQNEINFSPEITEPEIENGVHLATGLQAGDGLQIVINNCTNCHSARLITQNRMSAASWRKTIHWMQKTQNLWDLGENEEVIVRYLATHYAPYKKGRRQQLEGIDWYPLDLD